MSDFWKFWLTTVLIVLGCKAVCGQTIYRYDNLPRVQTSMSVYSIDHDISGGADPIGNGGMRREFPWHHSGGLHNCDNITFKRVISVPKGKWIELYNDYWYRDRVVKAEYPIGTIVAERMYYKGRWFETRSRTKLRSNYWEPAQYDSGWKPPGYEYVDNCSDCHSDAGKHSREVRPDRDHWYGTGGLEEHGPLRFHPWVVPEIYGPYVIRNDVRHFVKWKGN